MIPVPFEIPLILGDSLRNLRSSLDYLPSSMARTAGLPGNQTLFPFGDKRSVIEQNFVGPKSGKGKKPGRKASALYKLSLEYPDLQHIILDRIKPFSVDDGAEPSGDLLWRIITTDNIDKHRIITPVIQFGAMNKLVTNQGFQLEQIGIIGDPKFPPGTTFSENSDYSVDILFKEPARLADKPVISTLVDGCGVVNEVIEIFESAYPGLQ